MLISTVCHDLMCHEDVATDLAKGTNKQTEAQEMRF